MSVTTGVVRLQKNRTTTLMSVPKPFMQDLHWRPGDRVYLEVEGNRLVVRSIEEQLNIKLSSMPEGGLDG